LLLLVEVLPDEAERVLEVDDPVALENDQQPGVRRVLAEHDIHVVHKSHELLSWADVWEFGATNHLKVVEAGHLLEEVGKVFIDGKVPYALHWNPSFHLSYSSDLKILVVLFHEEVDALLSQSEEGESHDEVGCLDKAVVGEKVLVRALRKKKPPKFARSGL
jgi:hypothetical protein